MTPEQKQRIEQIRERVERLERAEKHPHVKTWDGAYYSDVYFLLSLVKSQEAHQHRCECAEQDNEGRWIVFSCDEIACTGKRYCPPCLNSAVQIASEVMEDY